MTTSTKGKSTSEEAAADQAKDVENQREGADEVRSELEKQSDRGEATLLGVDDTVSDSLFDEADTESYVVLKQDVIEEFRYPNTTRPAYRVLYTKGQRVQRSAIEAYNRVTEQRKAPAPEGDAAVVAQIDSTTLAAGTTPGIGALEAQADQKASGSKK